MGGPLGGLGILKDLAGGGRQNWSENRCENLSKCVNLALQDHASESAYRFAQQENICCKLSSVFF